ncbi:MAG: hypothetical protein ACM33T_09585 [Solirubrobacterales bacterium]
MLRALLKFLFLDKQARRSLEPRAAPARRARPTERRPEPPPERTPAQALAEAEERMVRLPPEKAQLVRAALLVQRARQSVLADLTDEERDRLAELARTTLTGSK